MQERGATTIDVALPQIRTNLDRLYGCHARLRM
jgi:hypothetical protein